MMRTGVTQLHRWGLLDRVIAAGTPAVRRTVFRYGDAATTVTLKPLGGVDALYAPRRTVLDPILVDAAGEAGADVRFGTTVTGVARATDGRVIGVEGRDQRGELLHLRAGLTIGADGLHSTVAGAVDAPLQSVASHASAFIYAHVAGVEADAYEWFYAPGVTAGLVPTNNGETCVWVGVPHDRFRAELARDIRGSFRRLLAEVSPELATRAAVALQADRLRSFPGVAGFMRHPWGPGWALVGDAGYYKDPISAHGMSDALRDAELLANAITAVQHGELSEAAAMTSFHDTRDRLSHRLFKATGELASYEWDTGSVEPLLRCVSAAMTDEVEYLLALDPGLDERLAG
jgi:2-polyprenyl-6-methoxyphenol hydroxylase-like FAD-dependent oxidoreductase